MMDWAACTFLNLLLRILTDDGLNAAHARSRGAPWWKSFSTGKTASTHGGIPHDAYVPAPLVPLDRH